MKPVYVLSPASKEYLLWSLHHVSFFKVSPTIKAAYSSPSIVTVSVEKPARLEGLALLVTYDDSAPCFGQNLIIRGE